MEQLTSIEQYNSIVERYRRPGCMSNDYLQARAAGLIASGMLQADCREANAYLLEAKHNCHRLYYYINDIEVLDQPVLPSDVVTEILYRGAEHFPTDEVSFLERMGFKSNLVRDQYAAVYKDLAPAAAPADVQVRPAVSIDEVAWAVKMFNDTFDPYSGDFIDDSELPNLFQDNQVLMAVDEVATPLGALHQTVERSVAWISHVAVVPAARGQHVGHALLDAFVERNHATDKSRYMLWVQQQNTAAVTMYQKKGFRYLGKSTLSLILTATNS